MTRGGNKDRDFSQSYQEHQAGSFAAQAELLATSEPELLQRAVAAWDEWYTASLEQKQREADADQAAAGQGLGPLGTAQAELGPLGPGEPRAPPPPVADA